MTKDVGVYLSISSPFSYLAFSQLTAIRERTGCQYNYHLVDLRQIWDLAGNPGPAQVISKFNYLGADALRWADYYGIPLNLPETFIFDNLPSARVFQTIKGREAGKEFISRLLEVYWIHGEDFSNAEVLGKVAVNTAGLTERAVAAALTNEETKVSVRAEAKSAVSHGVFGVPAFVVDDILFWGNDRLVFLERYLLS